MSPPCSLCNQHPEDVPHLFCNCAKTQDLCNSFAGALGGNLDLPQVNPTLSSLANQIFKAMIMSCSIIFLSFL